MSVRPTTLRFYLHDLADFFLIQILGELKGADIPELNGCCATAKTTLVGRKLVIDVRQMQSADARGEEWLAMMQAEGAEVIRTQVSASEGVGIREGAAHLLRLAFRANRGAQ